MKRFLSVVLTAVLAMTVLAGCGGSKKPVVEGEPIGIRLMQVQGVRHDANPESVVSQKMIEETGVYINELIYDEDGSKLQISFSSGDVPDMVKFNQYDPASSMNYNKLIDENQLVDVTQYITDDMPNLKKIINDKTAVSRLNVVAGKDPLYAIPFGYPLSNENIEYRENVANIWAREDWLEIVGVDAGDIVTPDDLKELLVKFKEQIPDVNGKPIIPAILRANGGHWPDLAKGYATPWFFIQPDGTMSTQHYHELYVKTIEFLADLYSTGLLDPESYTQQDDMVKEKIVTGRVGVITGSTGEMVDMYNPTIAELYPEAKFVPLYNMIEGRMVDEKMEPESRVAYLQTEIKGYVALTTKTVEDGTIDDILRMLEYIASEEGQLLVNLGVEGVTWEKVEGKPALKEDIYKDFSSDQKGKVMTEYGIDAYNFAGYDMHYELVGGDQYNWQYIDEDSDYYKFRDLLCKEIRPAVDPDPSTFVIQMPEFQSVVADKIYEVMTPIQNKALTASSAEEGRALAEQVLQAGKELGMDEFLALATEQYHAFADQFK